MEAKNSPILIKAIETAPNSPASFRLQVEAYGLVRFLTVVDNPEKTTIQDLKQIIEQDILSIYGWSVKVFWIKDQNQNDISPRCAVAHSLRDMEQIYIFISFISSKSSEDIEQSWQKQIGNYPVPLSASTPSPSTLSSRSPTQRIV